MEGNSTPVDEDEALATLAQDLELVALTGQILYVDGKISASQ